MITKVSVVSDYKYDVSVDFRIVKDVEFITTLHHFTGSKDHNVRMRQLAKERGEKISEYGVENLETGEVLTFETEEQFYHSFWASIYSARAYVRMGQKSINMMTVIHLSLLKISKVICICIRHGVDGAYSIEEMVEACRAKGYTYMAITDHSQYLKVANGLTAERLREQKKNSRIE